MSRPYNGEIACPHCGGSQSYVTNTTGTKLGDCINRRRQCTGCDKRFTTSERVRHSPEAFAALDALSAQVQKLRALLRGHGA